MEVISIERSTYEELHPRLTPAPYQGALNLHFAFILGRIALIFQNPLPITTFFRNFADESAKLLRFGKKRNKFLCFALNFS